MEWIIILLIIFAWSDEIREWIISIIKELKK